MKSEKVQTKKQLFICCHQKPDGSGCASKGSEGLRTELKNEVQALQRSDVKVTKSGCLGHCSEGIAGVLYPEGELLKEISPDDKTELLNKLLN